MPKCKPGDLAMIIRDGCPENIGAQVHVLSPFHPETLSELLLVALLETTGDIMWNCQVLQPVRSVASSCVVTGDLQVEVVPPGFVVGILDSRLEPIIPPADTDALYRTEPLEGEKQPTAMKGVPA